MQTRYRVMVRSGHTYVKIFTGDYQTAQWRADTLRKQGKQVYVEIDL